MKNSLLVAIVASVLALAWGIPDLKTCYRDYDCPQATDLFCVNNKCDCQPPKRFNGTFETVGGGSTRAICILVYGSDCNSDMDCANLQNSTCDQNKCDCKGGYFPNESGVKCTKEARPNEYCESASNCIPVMGDNAECKGNKCVCRPAYHLDTTNTCIASRDLGNKCTKDECYHLQNDKNTLECNNGICSCKAGYVEKDGTCNGASTLTISVTIILLSVWTVVKL